MRYKVIWEDAAAESLEEIGRSNWTVAEKIRIDVEKHLATNPTVNGKPMWGRWKGFWRYKVDKHRIIYEIVYEVKEKEKEIIILVVEAGERKDVYQGELPRPTSKNRTVTERPKARDLKKRRQKENLVISQYKV